MRAALVSICALVALVLAGAGQTRTEAATVKVAFLQGEQLVLLTRGGTGVRGVADALLAGPTAAERTKDTRTAIPDRHAAPFGRAARQRRDSRSR